MKKVLLIIIILALALFVIVNSKKSENKTDKETIKIGVSLPLTGNISDVAINVREAMKISLEQYSSNPNNKYNYKLIFEDDGSDPKKGSLSANKLINVDKVDAVISYGSACGNVISRIADSKNKFHIGIGTDKNIAKGKNNFIHWTVAKTAAKKLYDELKSRGYENVALLLTKHSGIFDVSTELKKIFDKNGIKYVEESVNPGEKNILPIVKKMEQNNPEIYISIAFSPTQEILAKELKNLNINKPITSIYMFAYSNYKDLFNGYWYVDSKEASKELSGKVRKRTNVDSNYAIGNGYNVIKIIYEAAESYEGDGKPNSDYISKYISSLDSFYGEMGMLSIDKEGIIDGGAMIKCVENSKIISCEGDEQ
jgi:branched-chain amino acid transport system substrate-binding protein